MPIETILEKLNGVRPILAKTAGQQASRTLSSGRQIGTPLLEEIRQRWTQLHLCLRGSPAVPLPGEVFWANLQVRFLPLGNTRAQHEKHPDVLTHGRGRTSPGRLRPAALPVVGGVCPRTRC